MANLIVSNGRVVDGTGAPARAADVVVAEGRIRAIVPPGTAASDGASVLDATDKIVTPGFVDVHTHYDKSDQR